MLVRCTGVNSEDPFNQQLMNRCVAPRRTLTEDEEGQLGVLQVVHHHHVAGEVVADREEQLGLGGRRAVHDAQVVLPQKRQRRHGDALHLALGVLALVLVAGQSPDTGRQDGRKQH